MSKASPQLICQLYLALALLVSAGFFPDKGLVYLVLALVLALVLLFFIVRPQPPRYNIALDMALIFITPLILATPLVNATNLPTLAIRFITLVLTLPAFYLLDCHLRENVPRMEFPPDAKGERRPTDVFLSLLVAALAVMLIAPLLNRLGLLFTGIAFLVYLLSVLIWTLLLLPRPAFSAPAVPKRIIAGAKGDISLELSSRASVRLRGYLNPAAPWMQVVPRQAMLNTGVTRFTLSFTPPLAGQSRPRLTVSALDPRGLFRISESLEPVNLHVIPRAEYAAWLARKYLEQTRSGALSAATALSITSRPKRGTEYQESRDYRPGDPLRDIDWKHTLKLSQVIVREYQEAGEQAAVIAVNLAVTDEEARDKLAFNLITVALTLARENIPSALTAYNHQSVVRGTGIIESSDMLVQALSLINDISIVEFSGRLLEPIDIAKIRRNIKQLQRIKTRTAQRLLNFLDFEHRSTEEVARNHPATHALMSVTRNIPAPAMIFLVSQFNHDIEAVLVTAEKLAKRNFDVLPVTTA